MTGSGPKFGVNTRQGVNRGTVDIHRTSRLKHSEPSPNLSKTNTIGKDRGLDAHVSSRPRTLPP